MKKLAVVLLALFGLAAGLALVALIGLGLLTAAVAQSLPSRVILELDFDRGVLEALPDDPLGRLMLEERLELRDVVDALDRAAGDRRVVAVLARAGGSAIGLAHLQEIRDAVARFRRAGKPAVAFAESFGEFGPGNGGYYLATAFDQIALQPSGSVGLTGLIYETPFVRGLLDKLAIRPEIGQRYEYKNAVNFYTESGFTEPHRRAMAELMESQFGQLIRGIAAGRSKSEDEVRQLFDRGPFLGREALAEGLVDRLAYRDEVLAELRAEVGSRAEPVGPERYLRQAGAPHRRGATIALIEGQGTLLRGRSGYSPLDGSITMGSDTIVEAFRDAVDDRQVRAIVFRVDSPGGSPVAADAIWRETIRAREADKPVVVSMANVAASGGYYVATHAHKIVAEPGTITASIGVYGGKFYTREFWGKLGITWDDVATSAHSRMWSPRYGWSEGGPALDALLDEVYRDFTGKVVDGRGIAADRLDAIARGRVWTGETALELGLVDALGGIDVALDLVREALEIEAGAPLRIKRFPRPRSTWELLFERRESVDRAAVLALARSFQGLQPAIRGLRRLGLLDEDGSLTVPEIPPAP